MNLGFFAASIMQIDLIQLKWKKRAIEMKAEREREREREREGSV